MYLEALRTSIGISCLVGWSLPLAMIVTPLGLSQLFSRTVDPPGVCVKLRGGGGARVGVEAGIIRGGCEVGKWHYSHRGT